MKMERLPGRNTVKKYVRLSDPSPSHKIFQNFKMFLKKV